MDIYFKKVEKVVLPGTYLMENPLARKQVRLATPEDYAAILSIYTPYILDTTVTFEYEVPSVADFTQRLSAIAQTYPILVLEVDELIIGYAYATAFKPRAAYQWTAETVIYLSRDCDRRGLGQILYQALLEVIRLQGVCQGIGVITSENLASVGFHRKMGYKETANLEKVGYKFGKWLDVCWMQNSIAPLPEAPVAIRPISEVAGSVAFRELLEQINTQLNNH